MRFAAPQLRAMAEIAAETWRRLRPLLDRALELPHSEHAKFLAELPAEHADLREDLARLLAEHARTALLFDETAADVAVPLLQRALANDAEDTLGRRFGAYRITRLLGVGGMGVVYLAERADGKFAQQVALKVVQTGVGASAHERFERERQILAGLVHPNIAALYDGGELSDGQAFYTMEYVDGTPITLHCMEAGCDIDARVRLLRDVAATLAFAHRNLVVHRDIKPSNILVTDAGRVKLLDFGIAKLIGADHAGTSPTLTAQAGPMTPDYAAPEQFRNEPITVATDVYQFGMLCFRVFTGAAPYRADPADPYAWARAVAEDEPISLARAFDNESLRSAWGGRIDAKHLRSVLSGDLNAIIRKMLAKAPADRYGSMDAVCADFNAYLDRRPVSARGGNLRYRVGRFVRRHRYAVATGIVVLGLLFATEWFALRQMNIARDQAERAAREAQVRSVTGAMLTDLLRAGPAGAAAQRPTSALQALDQNTERTLRSLSGNSRQRAIAVVVLAGSYLDLDHAQRARELIERTLPALEKRGDELASELLDLRLLLARAAAELGDVDTARYMLVQAGPMLDAQPASAPERLAAELTKVRIADHEGRRAEAAATAARLLREGDQPGLRDTLEFADVLRVNAVKEEDEVKGVELMQRAWQIVAAHYGEDSPAALAMQRLVIIRDTVYGARKLDAQHLLAAQEEQIRAAFGKQSTDYADVLQLRCEIAESEKDLVRAESLCAQVLAIREGVEEADSTQLADAYDNEGALLLKLGRSADALPLFERELAIRSKRFAPTFINVIHARLKIAEARCHAGSVSNALTDFGSAITDYVAQVGPQHPYEAVYAAYFARCLLDAGRAKEARMVLEQHARLDPARQNMSARDRADVEAQWQRLPRL
jgi:serine/threonine-protein kinase